MSREEASVSLVSSNSASSDVTQGLSYSAYLEKHGFLNTNKIIQEFEKAEKEKNKHEKEKLEAEKNRLEQEQKQADCTAFSGSFHENGNSQSSRCHSSFPVVWVQINGQLASY